MTDCRGTRIWTVAAAIPVLLWAGCRAGLPAPPAESVAAAAPSRAERTERVYEAIRLKRWRSALLLLDSLIVEDPGDLRLRMQRGYIRQAQGEPLAAADEFTVVSRTPNPFQEQAKEALKVVRAQASPEAGESLRDALVDQGYDDLRRGSRGEARRGFEKALAVDPGKTVLAKQLGYMSLADGDLAAAARSFEAVRRLAPRDYRTALELGFLYDRLRDRPRAERAFLAALPSPDPEVREPAARALRSLRSGSAPFTLDLYAAPYHTTRFGNRIVDLEARAGYKPASSGPVGAFLALRYTRDSRSRVGSVPDVYADNALFAGPGVSLQAPGGNARLAAEWGVVYNLLRTPAHPRPYEAAARVVLSDYGYWDAPGRLFADAGGSVGYYSRYRHNIIGDLQLRGGLALWDGSVARLLAYAPLKAIKDKNRDFYNNIVEYGAGAELQPWVRAGLRLRLEWLHGRYLGISGRDPNPYARAYQDTRLTLVYSARFTARPAEKAPPPPAHRPYLW